MNRIRPVLFQYPHPADYVLLGGSFTEWKAVPMERNGDSWEVILNLIPGIHLYKFVVDGEWFWDYDQPHKEINGFMNNIIEVPPPIDTKLLVIIRGVSGSGKTTLAKKLLLKYGGFTVAEADQFMVDSAGNYSFNPKRLTFAHESCSNKVENAMSNQENIIIVSNTSIQYWEMYNYVILAQKYGYDIEFMESDTEWRYNSRILHEKNHHQVPIASINRQLENFKKNPTLSKDLMIPRILDTSGCRPTSFLPGIHSPYPKFIYYGITSIELTDWIEKAKSYLGPEKYADCYRNRAMRDGGTNDDGMNIFHVTLSGYDPDDNLNAEQAKIYMEGLKRIKEEGSPEYLGLGKVQYEDNQSYYILIKWDEVNDLRTIMGLRPLNLHVTLGFDKIDVHNVPKTLDTLINL